MAQQETELASIKKPGEKEIISKEEYTRRIRELAKCKRDIIYFANTYFKIISLDKGLINISLYPKQEELLKELVNSDRVSVLASRQTGKCVSGCTSVTFRDNGFINQRPIVELFTATSSNRLYYDQSCKKFVESHSFKSNLEVLTDTGWAKAVAIHKTIPYRRWIVKTNKHELECADDHIVFKPDYQEVFVKDLVVGDAILTEDGTELVVSIHESTMSENMYDIELSTDTNRRYYTNGILSHNTTTYTIFVLWYAMFYSEKRIMICANKLQTAIEIMDRIRLAYEYLPKWIKAAITVYNKQEITFSNNSSIRAFATSSAAARGFTCNCVDGSTKITIRLFGFLKLCLPIKFLKWLGVNTHV